jgi:hypothetical protein
MHPSKSRGNRSISINSEKGQTPCNLQVYAPPKLPPHSLALVELSY